VHINNDFIATGCGKKRSDESVPTKDYEYDRESSIENSEDPIDDMARDILAEARLWEAFQARNSMRLPTVRICVTLKSKRNQTLRLTMHRDTNMDEMGDKRDLWTRKITAK